MPSTREPDTLKFRMTWDPWNDREYGCVLGYHRDLTTEETIAINQLQF